MASATQNLLLTSLPQNSYPVGRYKVILQGDRAVVPSLGVNYLNWVMGPFNLGNGQLFSISVLTASYFVEDKLARENAPNRRIN